MIKFELSSILEDSNLSFLGDEINDLASRISLKTSDYIVSTKEQTTGVTSDSGNAIIGLPDTDRTASFINETHVNIQNRNDLLLPEIYLNSVWQVLIATQTIPLGWLYNNSKYYNVEYGNLYWSWKKILLDKRPLYPHITSFGLLCRKFDGNKRNDLVFFAIYNNQVDYEFLITELNDFDVDNIVLMTENEYASKLLNGVNYKFLVKFDKSSNIYTGTVFKANNKLTQAIPTLLLKVGCSLSSVLYRDKEVNIRNPRLNRIEFKKGSDVEVKVFVPTNHKLYMVSLNGASYFTGTNEMDAAGITVVKIDENIKTGYDTYVVTLSRVITSSTLYIASCEDLSTTQTTKSIISKKSSLVVNDSDVSINLIFNNPFIYLNTDKIKVWARKDDESEEELISDITFITDGYKYIERQALYSEPDIIHHSEKPIPPEKIANEKYHHPLVLGGRPNPNIHYSHRNKNHYHHNEPKLTSHAIMYSVAECGSVILTFDNYIDYKYFRVEFEPDAMVSVYKIPGGPTIDVIPYIKDTEFINKTLEEDIEIPDSGDNTDVENPDSGNETPDTGDTGSGNTEENPDVTNPDSGGETEGGGEVDSGSGNEPTTENPDVDNTNTEEVNP